MARSIKFKNASQRNKPRGERAVIIPAADIEMTIAEIEKEIAKYTVFKERAQAEVDAHTSKVTELQADLDAAEAL